MIVYVQCPNPQCQAVDARKRPSVDCTCCGHRVPDKKAKFLCKECGTEMKVVSPDHYDRVLHGLYKED